MADDCPECEICCAIGLCCPPGSDQQISAVASAFQHKYPDWPAARCRKASVIFLKRHNYFAGVDLVIRELTD